MNSLETPRTIPIKETTSTITPSDPLEDRVPYKKTIKTSIISHQWLSEAELSTKGIQTSSPWYLYNKNLSL